MSSSPYADLTTATTMLLLVVVMIVMVLLTVVIIPRMHLPDGVNSTGLGWMSEQWLAEHRASHPM